VCIFPDDTIVHDDRIADPRCSGNVTIFTNTAFAVEIKSAEDCPRYAARLLKNVRIGPSPWWLQRLLLAVGLRPINNVVDVTNFIMLEYGQPLHAFDFAKLAGGRIIVRKAAKGEKTKTLDGLERQLDEEMLLICDQERPIATGIEAGAVPHAVEQAHPALLETRLMGNGRRVFPMLVPSGPTQFA